jgi:hypothetical protein
MSTQINVVVDGGGLVDRSKEQTQANRWAKAEADARQAALNEGLRQRDGRLQQDGRAPDGGPLYGSASDARSRLDEPVGRVNLAESMLMVPTSGPVNGQVPLKSRGFPKFGSVVTNASNRVPIYEPTGGPNGSAAFASEGVVYRNTLINFRYPYEGSTSRYKQGVKDFTAQFYVKLTESSTMRLNQPWGYCGFDLGNSDRLSIYLTLRTDIVSVNPVVRRISREVDIYVSGYEDGIGIEAVLYDKITPLDDPTGPQLMPGTWHHVAMCKKGNDFYAFFDGGIIGQASIDWPVFDFSGTPDDDWADVYFGNVDTDGSAAEPVRVHGLKFEARAVYTAPFTPPPFIT